MHRSAVVCVLAIGAAIGAAVSPSPFLAVLGFEVPACDPGQFVFTGAVTVKVLKVGADSILEAKHKGVGDKLEEGLTALGGDPSNQESAQGIKKTVKEAFDKKKNLIAITHFDREFSWGGDRRADNTIRLIEVTWNPRVVTLLPENASTQLTNHEDGHRQIEEHVKDLAKARFQAESAKILDKNLDDATVTGMINAVKDTLIKIADAAHLAYDTATNHGKQGGENQQQAATNAFNAAAAANP